MKTNPVYKREIMVSARSIRLALVLLVFNGILALVALLNMYSTLAQVRLTAEVQYTSFLDLYLFVAALEFMMLICIMPAITAGCISGERERKTLELMMATKMRPWEIVVGKLMAALSTMALLVASSFPVLAMVFVYGGITLADILILLLCFAAAALLVGSLGVCCSALASRTTIATVATYGITAVVMAGTCAVNYFVWYMRSMRLDAYLASAGQAVIQRGSGGCLYLLLANPAATFLLIISRLTGRERVSVNAGQWFGNEMEGAVITHWASVSLVVQIGLAALLIWIAIRAISEKKK